MKQTKIFRNPDVDFRHLNVILFTYSHTISLFVEYTEFRTSVFLQFSEYNAMGKADNYILIEVPKECDLSDVKNTLTENRYICMCQNSDRLSFNKEYTENGFAEKVLYLRYDGDNDELYFRDYLIEYLEITHKYEKRYVHGSMKTFKTSTRIRFSQHKICEHGNTGIRYGKT